MPALPRPSASAPTLSRPISAPRLGPKSWELKSHKSGFSSSVVRPSTSAASLARPSVARSSVPTFTLSDLPSLASDVEDIGSILKTSVGERVAAAALQVPAATEARRKGVKAWGEGELQRAINEFSAVVDLEAAGSDAQVEALRLRCAGLLRSNDGGTKPLRMPRAARGSDAC